MEHNDGSENDSDRITDQFEGHMSLHTHADGRLCIMGGATPPQGEISAVASFAFSVAVLLIDTLTGSMASQGQKRENMATIVAGLIVAAGGTNIIDPVSLFSMAVNEASRRSGKPLVTILEEMSRQMTEMSGGAMITFENGQATELKIGGLTIVPDAGENGDPDRMEVYEKFLGTIDTDLEGDNN